MEIAGKQNTALCYATVIEDEYYTAISIMSRAVLWRLMVDRFESGTVLDGLGYGGKPYHFADDSKMLYRRNNMCVLCKNQIYTENKLNHWLSESSYDTDMPRNIIYKDIINNYLYSKVRDHTYNEDTRMLINYCPVCGERLT